MPFLSTFGNGSIRQHKLGKAPELYAFGGFTFTSGGVMGQYGPSLNQLRVAYAYAPWTQNSAFLDMQQSGYQLWTVPQTGDYKIAAVGAGGYSFNGQAGFGALMQGTFSLVKGSKLKILVGQLGNGSSYGGGGGGSFVATEADVPLVVAGGGASTSWWNASRVDALISTGNGLGGSRGNGSGGGGGFYTSGAFGYAYPGGAGFLQGGVGGSTCNGAGGFGGGAATDGCYYGESGAGGGYQGGNGGNLPGPSYSYNSGTNKYEAAAWNGPGLNGFVEIQKL